MVKTGRTRQKAQNCTIVIKCIQKIIDIKSMPY